MTQTPNDDYLALRKDRTRRMRFLTLALPAGIALLILVASMLIPKNFIEYELFRVETRYLKIFAVGLVVMYGGWVLIWYLQTGFKRGAGFQTSGSYSDRELRTLREQVAHQQVTLEACVDAIKTQSEHTLAAERAQQHSVGLLTDEDKQALVDSTARKVHSEAAEKVLSDLREQIAVADRKNALIHDAAERFGSTTDRLRDELAALSRRGNLNLVLGMFTTVAGLLILGYFVFKISDAGDQSTGLLITFVPRLSLVLFIEVFAYFFLRLYKASLSEIKYFQNELTNIESKAIALHTSATLGSPNAVQGVIEMLARTERNNILEKGQTTVELEHAKLKDGNLSTLMKELLSSIGRKESGA